MTTTSDNRKGLKRYALNTSWLMTERLLRAGVALVVGVYVARYLGPERFGVLSYAASFVALFSALASLGMDAILVRELVKKPDNRDELLGTVFCLKGVASVVTVVLVGGVALAIPHDALTYSLIVIMAVAFVFQSSAVVDMYFHSRVEAKRTVRVYLVQLGVSSLFKVTLVALEAPVLWFGVAILVDSVLLTSGFVLVYRQQKLSFAKWRYSNSVARQLIHSAWPLMLSGVLVSIYMKIDQVLVKQLLGDHAVGQYAAAARLVEALYLVPTVIAASLFPAISNARKISQGLYEERLGKLHRLLAWMALMVAVPVAVLSSQIIEVIFGTAFDGAKEVLQIQVWASVFAFLGVASSQYLLAEDMPRISLARTLIGCGASVSLNLTLIPILGIIGAAWASVISYAVATLAVGIFKPGRKALVFIIGAFMPWKWYARPTRAA